MKATVTVLLSEYKILEKHNKMFLEKIHKIKPLILIEHKGNYGHYREISYISDEILIHQELIDIIKVLEETRDALEKDNDQLACERADACYKLSNSIPITTFPKKIDSKFLMSLFAILCAVGSVLAVIYLFWTEF